jgi:photosystem II stability/assembly factor-like uncharacterized protein
VIWHTADGGASWNLQHQQRGFRLQSVYFVNARVGWAVGSAARAYPSPFEAVVLRTSDGGEHWHQEQRLLLPPLSDVRFFDSQRGIATCWPSTLHPTGVVISQDGGQSWTALPLEPPAVATASCFLSDQSGFLAQSDGRIRGFRGPKSLIGDKVTDGLKQVRGLTFLESGLGLAVGDGGLVLQSNNGGESWQPCHVPTEAAGIDWSVIESFEQSAWIAGSPGNLILATEDAGQTWRVYFTGQTLPINSLCFADQRSGYAVCPLGTVLKTEDGGRTWNTSRAGGKRAGWLAIYSDPQEFPLELAVKLGAASGYFGAAYFVARRDRTAWPGVERELPLRSAHVLDVLGLIRSEFAWGFPARERGIPWSEKQLVDTWDRLHGSRGTHALRDALVRQIRIWRPEVVFTSAMHGQTPLESLVSRIAVDAVEHAASDSEDVRRYAGLPAWRVKRLLGSRADSARSAPSLARAEVSTSLGCTLEQFAEMPGHYFPFSVQRDEPVIAFDVLANAGADENSANSLPFGLQAAPESETRRAIADPGGKSFEGVHRAAQYGRNLKAIVELADGTLAARDQVLSRLDRLLQEVDPDQAGHLVYSLSEQYVRAGNWQMAVEAWQMLTSRYPSHPMSGRALFRLLCLRTSGEAAHRFRDTGVLLAGTEQGGPTSALHAVTFEGALTTMQQTPAAPPQFHDEASTDRSVSLLKVVGSTAARLEQTEAALYSEPSARYPLAAFQVRHAVDAGRRYLSLLANQRVASSWRANAAAELWRSEPTSACPKSLVHCRRIQQKPYLDAMLNDAAYNGIERVELHSPYHDDETWRSFVLTAYDDEFLYFAGRCERTAGQADAATSARQRDADLTAVDRVEIYLDIDRDFSTYYSLAVDERGWIGDAFLEDTTWNPHWYVAQATDTGGWSFEAAIELSELAGSAPNAGTAWAIGLQRVSPRLGFQAATFPAAPRCQPEGFGLFRFE